MMATGFGHDFTQTYRRDGTPYPRGERGLLEWARDFERWGKRVVAQEYSPYGELLSTVWLGIDHNFFGRRPLIYESMILSGDQEYMWRYSTEEEAFIGHERMCFFALIPPPLRRFWPQ